MTRFHINIFNSADIADVYGHEYSDLATAKSDAIDGARAMMAEHVAQGKPIDLRHRVEVTDDSGKVLAVIPFGEIVTILS